METAKELAEKELAEVIDNADSMLDDACDLAAAHVQCRATLEHLAAEQRHVSYCGDALSEEYVAECRQRAAKAADVFWHSLSNHAIAMLDFRRDTLEQLITLKVDGER